MMVQSVNEGALVNVNGFEMVASEVKSEIIDIGEVVRFTGTCTENPKNDSIRGTGYDGARYGGSREVYNF